MNQMPRNAGGVEPYTAHIPQGGWFAAWSNFTAQVKTTLAPFFQKICARCQWFTKTGSGQTQRKLTIELCVSCTQASIYFNRGLPMDLQVRKNALLAASFFLKTVGCQDRLRDQIEKKSSKRKDRFGGSADVRRPARPQRLELHDERSQCERGPRGARAGV
jgi:hypothetical protein